MQKRMLIFISIGSLFFGSCAVHKTVQASADYVNQHTTGNSAPADEKARVDYNFGVFFEDPLGAMGWDLDGGATAKAEPRPVSLRAGLQYMGKGGKESNGTESANLHLNYLEVPLTAVYSFRFDNHSRLFAGIGPCFGYGIGGKIKGSGFSESSFGENNGGFKRFDVGGTALVGYELGIGFSVNLAYEYGFSNIAYTSTDTKAYNRALSFNVGYSLDKLLGKKK